MENNIAKYFKRIIFSQQQIENKVKNLAQWVNTTYAKSQSLTIVCLLKGAFPFAAELVKNLTIPNRIEFMRVSSYNGNIKSVGRIEIVVDLLEPIAGKDVLIVDEIVDTGITLLEVSKILQSRQPLSLRTMALFDKSEARTNGFQPDKIGFQVENVFLVGFGLDFNDHLRTVPFVGEFDQSFMEELNK